MNRFLAKNWLFSKESKLTIPTFFGIDSALPLTRSSRHPYLREVTNTYLAPLLCPRPSLPSLFSHANLLRFRLTIRRRHDDFPSLQMRISTLGILVHISSDIATTIGPGQKITIPDKFAVVKWHFEPGITNQNCHHKQQVTKFNSNNIR